MNCTEYINMISMENIDKNKVCFLYARTPMCERYANRTINAQTVIPTVNTHSKHKDNEQCISRSDINKEFCGKT